MNEAFNAIPTELRSRTQWVLWRPVVRNGRMTKVPVDAKTGGAASSTDSNTWGSFDEVIAQRNGNPVRVGYVFSAADPYTGIDLDSCRDPDTGALTPEAAAIVKRLNSYTEVSPSGKGLHIFVRGKLTGTRRRAGHFETYDSGRFFCTTGDLVPGAPTTIEPRQDELDSLCREMFPTPEPVDAPASVESDTPAAPLCSSVLSDDAIFETAGTAKNAEKFLALWNGGLAGLPSESEADLALCAMLAFYVPDSARIDALFRKSKRLRAKWERADYRAATIQRALAGLTATYDPNYRSEAATPFHTTDTGNGERLVARHGDNVRFCKQRGTWLTWRGHRWVEDTDFTMQRLAIDTARSILVEAQQETDTDRRNSLVKWAFASESGARLAEMLDAARALPGITVQEADLDVDPWLLGCPNGVLDLRTGELRDGRREDLITKCVTVVFDPHAACPRWEGFLADIMASEDLVEFLHRATGYSITGSIRDQALFILSGTGANGKSTFIELLCWLLGDYGSLAAPDLLTARRNEQHPTEIMDLQGRRLVAASETEEAKSLRVQLVKSTTGDSKLKGRRMRCDFVEFPRTHKTWLSTNNRPRVREATKAIWRRIKLIPFSKTIPDDEQDHDLPEKLRGEGAGILGWLVKGCLSWQADGLCEPPAVTHAVEEYRAEQDVLMPFLEDTCVLHTEAFITRRNIWAAYGDWVHRTGEKWPLDRSGLYERIRARGCTDGEARVGGRSQRGFRGVGLRDTADTKRGAFCSDSDRRRSDSDDENTHGLYGVS